ncbi:MAG: DUF86 domain-containing protein [Deltaproteobacteria bacterium]|nr:DUF86 domain-containing protein [Deltaproteobacteria bacterium]
MVDVDVVTAKLAELARRIARVRSNVRSTKEQLAADLDALELVSFNLMLAVQTCVDVASHVIADEGLAPAPTIADSFRRLAEHGVISSATAAALARAGAFRNVVAHGYATIDVAAVHAASTAGVVDLESFQREVAGWLTGRSRG